ncbi:MAG: dipeptide epimerase [Methyloligellaceae bacterium]
MPPRRLTIREESWPIRGTFTIARGSKRAAEVLVAQVSEGERCGRGECVPYRRYGETMESVRRAIEEQAQRIAQGMTRATLQQVMPPGAARNALDCALWDLEARMRGMSVAELAGLPPPEPLLTAFTISLGTPEEMAEKAAAAAHHSLLKLKLGAPGGDDERLKAVRAARPDARLIVDANEGWDARALQSLMEACVRHRVELVEQPLPEGRDEALEGLDLPLLVCADESLHTSADLETLRGRYDAINIKLDKTGGLTEALQLMKNARAARMKVMVGCMVATSLAMAPALLLASQAHYADLDGPLLLTKDRAPGLHYEGDRVHPPSPGLWG